MIPEFGLAAGVFTADLALRPPGGLAASGRHEPGSTPNNLTPVEAPFGGVKQSGIGRENGHAAIEHYTHLKSVYVATGPVDSPY